MKKIFAVALFVFLISGGVASAHQPRLVGENGPVIVSEPEISKAYYGELKGEPAFFEINSAAPFDLYVNVLSPDIAGAKKDFSVDIYFNDELLKRLDGANYKWHLFYEPFGNDTYWWGPEYREPAAPAGKYKIAVSSPENSGRYSLAIGEAENFSPKEILNAVKVIPKLKTDFFGKPAYDALFGVAGSWLMGAVLGFFAAIFAICLVRKLIKIKLK